MKTIILFQLFILGVSCDSRNSFRKAEDAQDAGREFIRASLDGNYEKAEFYLLQDTTNQLLMDKWKKDYDQLDHDGKRQYKEADIIIINVSSQNDSVTTYTFSNSYKKDTTTIRIVRISGEWLVDLKEILNRKK